MPSIPFLPFYFEVVVWVYLVGLMVNLPLWLLSDYHVCRYRKKGFLDVEWVTFDVGVSVLWFVVWILFLDELRRGRTEFRFAPNLLGAALGVRWSVEWMVRNDKLSRLP